MEKGFEYWFHNQNTDLQSPYSSSLRAPFNTGQQTTTPVFGNTCPDMISPNGSLPMFTFAQEQQSHIKTAQPLEPSRGWFYCMPRFRQAFSPVHNSTPKEKPVENHREAAVSTEVQNRFVVFDQSGDQTTLLFSSAIDNAVQCQKLPSWGPKPYCSFDFKRDDLMLRGGTGHSFQQLLADECEKEKEKNGAKSEMHEDTEELNALLYSDDEVDYSEDEEETSTGHSPSTMTGCDGPKRFAENGEDEEVASCGRPSKRQKLVHGYIGSPSLMDSASSLKTSNQCLDYEDDAESRCCGDGKNQVIEEFSFGNKLERKEKIRETISILQNLIPGLDNGQDAVMILDEAIHYLTSLKVKVKSLGIDCL